MRKLALLTALLTAFSAMAFGQTAEEIVDRMNQEMTKGEKQGTSAVFSIRMPIIGEVSSRIKSLGDYSRAETEVKDEKVILWVAKDTSWTYSSAKNEVVIEYVKKNNQTNNGEDLIKDITDGYNVSLAGETADTWQILCKKSKDNKDKDDPGKMDLVVSKKNYAPVSLKAKVKGITITLRDFVWGVNKAEVTFDPSAYPGLTITDKR
ncbi:MAG: hypothetical protein IJK05_02470 [Bacteroidales bacterium]|nr:hypothetical protein [Bacteroidales bacterium]